MVEEGVIVEIDETHFGKGKFDRGRPLSDIWVFGGIERASKKSFLVPLVEPLPRQRTADNLLPLINKYIKPQSVIISDKWRAYNKLGELGYIHKCVNHSDNFVDPEDPTIHTQNIERLWRDIKEWIKRPGNRSIYFKQYISRYLFLHKYPEDKLLHHFFFNGKPVISSSRRSSATSATTRRGGGGGEWRGPAALTFIGIYIVSLHNIPFFGNCFILQLSIAYALWYNCHKFSITHVKYK